MFGLEYAMTRSTPFPRTYGDVVVVTLLLQCAAWMLCLVAQPRMDSFEHDGGLMLNWRTWTVSCCVYWFCFLIALLTKPASRSLWQMRCLAFAYPVLFVTVAALLWRFIRSEP